LFFWLILLFKAHHSAGMKINKERTTATTGNLLTCHSVLERDHITLLKGYGQAFEQKREKVFFVYVFLT